MAHGALPPGLAETVARFDDARRARLQRRQEAAPPRPLPNSAVLARHRPPDAAAKASPRALADAITGELPWWARD